VPGTRGTDVLGQPDPAAPAHEHFEVRWQTAPGGAPRRVALLAREVLGVLLGLRPHSEIRPDGIVVRRRGGPVIAGFTYCGDPELARRHSALVERQLSGCSVDEFLAFIRNEAGRAARPTR
jgi:hypothetical protein